MKKGLVCIHTAKSFADFIWYYCTYGEDMEWDIVLEPNLPIDEQSKIYEKSGLFNRIIPYDLSIWNNKYMLIIKCILSTVFGIRKIFAKKIINNVVGDYDKYDTVVIFGDYQFIEGSIVMLSQRKKVVWLEDGGADYKKREEKFCRITGSLFSDIAFYLIAKMGFASITNRYKLKNERYCYKFSTYPERIQCREFRVHKKINDFEKTDLGRYHEITKNVYNFDLISVDGDNSIILFTAPLKDFCSQAQRYVDATIQYIEKNHKGCNIYLKKHPRDDAEYLWTTKNKVIEIDNMIPAEFLLDNIAFSKEYYMFTSSILLLYGKGRNTVIFKYSSLSNDKDFTGGGEYEKCFEDGVHIFQPRAEYILL